ncbi:DUF1656 domain-containing protein [uncultured Aquitalea sp.]|uniref:DUF1656 domain-containing protein n=1 Tax=uncultured Aquitalea sp. TaxID=540272 RepID=UPI0025D56DF9|nr:DUF1656 domain-containing protein [uncultured Aquitalea sp.]
MIGEFEIYGVYFPSLLLMMTLAFGITALLRVLLAHIGFYRLVWHRSLMNFALYVIVLGALTALTHGWR